jgi:DNA-binding CsgD family transcriptional regulator/PAS domain-containing protein
MAKILKGNKGIHRCKPHRVRYAPGDGGGLLAGNGWLVRTDGAWRRKINMWNGPSAFLSKPDELLLDLYASAAQPARWAQSLDRLCVITGAHSAVVQAFRFEQGRAHILWSARDSRTLSRWMLEPQGVADSDNPRLDRQRVLRGLDRVANDELLFEPDDEARPMLQQRLATIGLGRFLGTLQDVGHGIFLGLALHRSVEDPDDFNEQHVNRLADLAPHVGQAFLLTDQLQTSMERDDRLRELMDRLCFGIVLCDERARVQWSNRRALGLLGRDAALMLRGEHLQGRNAADTQRLLGELAKVHGAGKTSGYLRMGQGSEALHIAIQAAGDPASLILVISSAVEVRDLPSGALERLFGLTPTEARLLAAIATGSTVEDYALQRGVSVGTARMQLKQVQTKTGQHRQSDLVRLVLSSAVAHLSPSGSIGLR